MISEDGTKTYRTRQHGNKHLPLPPLMDQIAIEAKVKHHKPKAEPEAEAMTEFQKQLVANPFAQALATPVRQCNTTRVRLPSHFLQRFTAAFVPRDNGNLEASILPANFLTTTDLPAGTSVSPSSSYVLNSRPVIEYLNKRHNWEQLVTLRMREAAEKARGLKVTGRKRVKEWSRDADMVYGIEEGMRKELQTLFQALWTSKGSRYVVPLRMLESQNPGLTVLSTSAGEIFKLLDQDYETLTLPVFDLGALLTPEQIRSLELQDESSAHEVAIVPHPRTNRLQMAMHKLGAYRGEKLPGKWIVAEKQELEQFQNSWKVGNLTSQ